MGLSPMMQQYLLTKEKYKDTILFYRLGDFYEMFFDDAIKVSSLLELTLTGRDCGLEERAPMCGIPYHAADTYIAKLVALGEKVAICEQLTQPKSGEIVKRDVIKIVTAGTVTNDELIDDKSNNFLGSVFVGKDGCAFAWADITTGEFCVRNFDANDSYSDLFDTLAKINPSEIISNKLAYELFSNTPAVTRGIISPFSQFTESEYNYYNAKVTLESQLSVINLDSFDILDSNECVSASGALIAYLKETQKHALININNVKRVNSKNLMMLDINAVRNLELVRTLRDNKRYGSLLWLLDKTKTSMGARKLQSMILSPLNDEGQINYRLKAVESLYNNTLIRQSVADSLSSVKDVMRLTGKISNGNLLPKDCIALRSSLEILPNIKFQLLGIDAPFIKDISENICDFSKTVSLLYNAIADEPPATLKDGGYIKSGFNKELDELRYIGKNGKKAIADIESKEKENTGIKTLKIGYNRVFGYYIEVTNSFKDKVPYNWQRRQTLTNAERYITEELKDLEIKIMNSEEKCLQIESAIYSDIKNYLSSIIPELQKTADAIANLDVLISFATVSKEKNYVRPQILSCDERLNIVDGRHPVIEAYSKKKFIPNDTLLDNDENRTMILTGPNMAGKSTYMRQTALIVLMAHLGCFVPAKSAEIPLTDKIFTRIGASDSLITDQSTFMVEMSELATILRNATKNSLLILDEIGRGTSTFDGLSIARASVEYLTNNIKAKTMFATHYHELTELEGEIEGIKNYKVSVKEMQGGIVFLRKIMRGGTNRSFGIEVAELAGVNKDVTERAKKLLKQLEKRGIKDVKIVDDDVNIEKNLSEVERIIADVDVNNLSPIQAFNILLDLSEKVKEIKDEN